jgi:hypothetical protein
MPNETAIYCVESRVLLRYRIFFTDCLIFNSVISAEGLSLARHSNKPPKAYVKMAFEGRKWQTETADRSVQPSWNKTFQL